MWSTLLNTDNHPTILIFNSTNFCLHKMQYNFSKRHSPSTLPQCLCNVKNKVSLVVRQSIYFYSFDFCFYCMTHSHTAKRFIQAHKTGSAPRAPFYYDYFTVVCFSGSQSNKLFLLLCLFIHYSAIFRWKWKITGKMREKKNEQMQNKMLLWSFLWGNRKKGKPLRISFASMFFPTHPLAFQMSRRLDPHQSHTLGCQTRLSLRHWLIINKNKGHLGLCSVLQQKLKAWWTFIGPNVTLWCRLPMDGTINLP